MFIVNIAPRSVYRRLVLAVRSIKRGQIAALATDNIFAGMKDVVFVPQVSLTSLINPRAEFFGPHAASAHSTHRVGLKIIQHSVCRFGRAHNGVDVIRPNIYREKLPAAKTADFTNRLLDKPALLRVEDDRFAL